MTIAVFPPNAVHVVQHRNRKYSVVFLRWKHTAATTYLHAKVPCTSDVRTSQASTVLVTIPALLGLEHASMPPTLLADLCFRLFFNGHSVCSPSRDAALWSVAAGHCERPTRTRTGRVAQLAQTTFQSSPRSCHLQAKRPFLAILCIFALRSANKWVSRHAFLMSYV